MIALYLAVGFVCAIVAAVIVVSLGLGLAAAIIAYCLGGAAGIAAVGAYQFLKGRSEPFRQPEEGHHQRQSQ